MTISLPVKRLFTVVSILVVSWGMYLNILHNEFVRDDKYVVLENKWITDIRYIPEIVTSNVWGFASEEGVSNNYRPLYHLFLMIGYYLSGQKPWGFHIVSILFHSLNSVLVFMIASILLSEEIADRKWLELKEPHSMPRQFLPFLAAMIFAAHPINTEAVVWVSAISETSFALFSFLSLYLYLSSSRPWDTGYIASIFTFFLAVCSKETALIAPLLIFVYDYFVRRKNLLQGIKLLIPFGIAAFVYLGLRIWVLGGITPGKASHIIHLTHFQIFLNTFPLIVQYIEKLLFPINLNFDYVFKPALHISEPQALISLTITAFLAIFAWWVKGKNRVAFLSLLWIFIPLLPILYIPALGKNTFTERYLYLSSAGFGLFVAWGIKKSGKEFLLLLVSIVIVLYSFGTVKRNMIWKDGYTLWGDTVKKSPDSRGARNSYGTELAKRGMFDEAIVQFKEAIRIDPNSALAYNNLGITYAQKGMLIEAIREFKKALEMDVSNLEVKKNLEKALKLLEHKSENPFTGKTSQQ